MPAAIIWAVSAIGASTGSSFLMIYAVEIAYAAILIGGLAYSDMKQRQAKADAKNAYNAAQVDRLINVSSAVSPRELVMGRARKGGSVFFKGSTGTNQKDLYMAIALAGHEIDAVEAYYLNDQLVTLDAEGYVQQAPYSQTETITDNGFPDPSTGLLTVPATYVPGSATAVAGFGMEVYSPAVTVVNPTTLQSEPGARVTYQWIRTNRFVKIVSHLGAAGQTVDPDLLAAFPADWVAANTVQGVAYLLVKFIYSDTAFPSGAANVTAVIRGAKLYDPRTGLTVWSQNPALMMRHVYQHAKFGKATVSSDEDARVIVAANACDTSTVYTVAGVAQAARALYTGSLVVPFGTAPKSAFDDLSQAMGGSWAFAGGSLYMKAGVYTASVMSLTDADLAVIQRDGATETQQPISISVHKERAQKFNTVKVKIWDQAQDYKQVSLTPLVGAALLARDGAELVQEVSYPAIGYAPQALHVAGVMMRDARDALMVELPFKLRAYRLEMFETVDLTLSRYGWVSKTFMIVSRTWNANGSLQLTLKETTAAITQIDAWFAAQGFASNTNLPKPWIVGAVGPLTFSTGTAELFVQQDGTVSSGMRVMFPQVADAAVIQSGQIEVRYRRSDESGIWKVLGCPGSDTQVVTSDVQDGAFYVVQARAKTTLGVGDWSIPVQVQVIGKTELPGNVAGLTIDGTRLMWEPVTDLDLAGYAIRYQYGTNIEWGTANPMHTGLITDMPYTMKSVPPGVVTILAKAVDTTGNESMSPAYVVTDLGDSLVANVVQTRDFRALTWPGTTTNTTLVSGNLQATQSDVFYKASAGDFYPVDSAAFYSNNYDGLAWESTGWTPSLAGVGSNMTAAWTLTGNAPSIQYRQTGAALFYSADATVFYESDAVRFYDEAPPWQSWPGSVVAEAQEYQWRVSTNPGTDSGLLSAFVVSVDVPDKTLKLNAVAISAGGTRLSASIGIFNVIENIQLTLQGGGTALSLEVSDYGNALGPLVVARNSAGTSVAATVDALLQGY